MHSKGIWPAQRLSWSLTSHSVTSVAEYLPESGLTDFCDAGCFVGQSGAASVVSGDVGKLTVVKTEGICKNKH